MPEFVLILMTLEIQRAQGRPGAGRTRGPRAAKKHAAEPQVRRTTGLPCAMVLTLIRALLGDRLDCPHRDNADALRRPQHREARTTRFRVRNASFVRMRNAHAATPHGHRFPASRVVTIARTAPPW